jgi:hypothetical protein
MRIRVIKGFNGYRVGQVFDWGDGMARVFIARGMVEPVEAVERAVVERDVEQAVIKVTSKRKTK